MKKVSFLFLWAAWIIVFGVSPLWAATQIQSIGVDPGAICPGNTVAVTVNYCENQSGANSYFLGALESSSNALVPCPYDGQIFVVDSNGVNVADYTPPGGWNANNASPVISCNPGTIVWNFTIPMTATLGSGYFFVVAGRTGAIDCTTTPDSQMAATVMVCGNPSATPTPTLTPTVTLTPTITSTPTNTSTPTITFTPTVTPTPTAAGPTITSTPSASPTATSSNTPFFISTLTASTTPTQSPAGIPSATLTPTPSASPTATPTNTPIRVFLPIYRHFKVPGSQGTKAVYNNTNTAVAATLGCTVATVDAVRQLNLDPYMSYIIMRLVTLCGCGVSDIMTLRLTMGWAEICAKYGVDWTSLVTDVENRTANLVPEETTANQVLRTDANDPNAFPIEISSPPVLPSQGLVFQAPIEGACP